MSSALLLGGHLYTYTWIEGVPVVWLGLKQITLVSSPGRNLLGREAAGMGDRYDKEA